MKKNILLIVLCVISLFSIIFCMTFAIRNNRVMRIEGGVITQRETALTIGRALLEEHFGLQDGIPLVVEEKSRTWIIRTMLEDGITEDGRPFITIGSIVYVEICKDSGRTLKMGIAD